MGSLRRFSLSILCVCLGLGVMTPLCAAGPGAGSKVLTIADAPLTYKGQAFRVAKAGEQFTVAGSDSARSQVFVFVESQTPGQRIVASIAAQNVTVIDAGPPATAAAPAPAATAPAAPPFTEVRTTPDGYISAADLAGAFKTNKAVASTNYRSKTVKVVGVIERIEISTGSLSSSPSPSLTLATGNGLPRVRVKLSPEISRDEAFYRTHPYYEYWGYYWWQDRKIEYRVEGNSRLMARTVYKGKRTTSYNTGGTYTSRYRHESEWFQLLTIGQEVALEGLCDGLMMDVQIHNAELKARSAG